MIVDVAKSRDVFVLDVAGCDVTTPDSSGANDGNPQVRTGTKCVAAHCEPTDRLSWIISATSSISLIDKCLEIG